MSEIPYIRTAVDVRLGDYYSDIDIDYSALAQRLRYEGLSDSQIETTSLNFSAETPQQIKGDDGAVLAVHGLYNKKTEDITMYPLHYAQLHQLDGRVKGMETIVKLMKEGEHATDNQTLARESEKTALGASAIELGEEFSGTLYHEIRHRRHDVVEPPKGVGVFYAKVIGRPLGAYALTYSSLNMIGGQIERIAHFDVAHQIGFFALSLLASIRAMRSARYSPEAAYMMNPGEVSAREAGKEAPTNLVSFVYRSYDETIERQQRLVQKTVRPLDLPSCDALHLTSKSTSTKSWWLCGKTNRSDS